MSSQPECLALAVDCGPTLSPAEFESVRALAERWATARAVYGQTMRDKVALIALGCDTTDNALASEAEAGDRFDGVRVVVPAARACVDTVRAVRALEQGGRKVSYPSALDVGADHVLARARPGLRKRVVLFTDGRGKIAKTRDDARKELLSFAKICCEHDVQLTVVLVDGLTVADLRDDPNPDETDEEDDGQGSSAEDEASGSSEGSDVDVNEEPEVECQPEEGYEPEEECDPGEEGKPEVEDEAESEGETKAREAYARVRKLMSTRRIDEAFLRRRRAHEAAHERRPEHRVPKDATILRQTLLARLARVLESGAWSLAAAEKTAEMPPRRERSATPKFHGVMDIAGGVRIPVKVFGRVRALARPSARKLAWESTVRRGVATRVLSKSRYVPAGDMLHGEEVEADDLMDMYPYGPDLVGAHNEVDACAWHMQCPKALSLICFVPEAAVPLQLLMDAVDAVLPMSGPAGCEPLRAMKALVRAMKKKKVGIAARYCSGRARSSRPEFVYLWPSEKDFLFMVRIPTAHDVRNYPFASLRSTMSEISSEAQRTMDEFVAARDLDSDVQVKTNQSRIGEDGSTLSDREDVQIRRPDVDGTRNREDASDSAIPNVNDDIDEFEAFHVEKVPNPTLDRFYTAVVRRALEGGEGTSGLPRLPGWAKRLEDPSNVIRPSNIEQARSSLDALCHSFHLTFVDRTADRRRTHVSAATGLEECVAHLFPPPAAEAGDEGRGNPEHEGANEDELDYAAEAVEFGSAPARGDDYNSDGENEVSFMTDAPLVLSDEAPVSDMEAILSTGRIDEAFDLMSTVIYRLARGGDAQRAVQCLLALRKCCAKHARIDEFHTVLARIAERATGSDRTASLYKELVIIARRTANGECLDLLKPPGERFEKMQPSIWMMRKVKEMLDGVKDLALEENSVVSGANESRI